MGTIEMNTLKNNMTIRYFGLIGLNKNEIEKIIEKVGYLNDILKFNKSELKFKLDQNFGEKTSNMILKSLAP